MDRGCRCCNAALIRGLLRCEMGTRSSSQTRRRGPTIANCPGAGRNIARGARVFELGRSFLKAWSRNGSRRVGCPKGRELWAVGMLLRLQTICNLRRNVCRPDLSLIVVRDLTLMGGCSTNEDTGEAKRQKVIRVSSHARDYDARLEIAKDLALWFGGRGSKADNTRCKYLPVNS